MSMVYPNPDRAYPSIFVDEGHTLTLSARYAHEIGIPLVKVQPHTTAALMVLAGLRPDPAPRLSDPSSFAQVESTEGLTSFSSFDQDGKVGGYSVSFLRGLLEAFDPNENVPPKTVKRLVPQDSENRECDCHSKKLQKAKPPLGRGQLAASSSAQRDEIASNLGYSVREAKVPEFLVNLKIFSLFARFGDIIVGRNATLVIDSDILFAIADNFLGYQGSRVIQRGDFLGLDITGLMRGSIVSLVHRVTTVVAVDFAALAAEPATKP